MIIPTALLFGLTQLSVTSASKSAKVAVIGAGAGGSSASYWLSLAKQRAAPGTDVSVTVYEKDTRVGGRSTTIYPYDDKSYAPIELGASIFTSSNRNMMRAASELGLDLVQFEAVAPGTGIWDGKQFVWRTTDNSTADGIRMGERYQDGPIVAGGLIGQFSANFSKSYIPTLPQWQNISSYAASLGYTPLQTITLQDYLDQNGVNKLWTREFMSGSARFNYGQDAYAMQAVAGMASLAASSAYSAKAGNWKIFEGLLAKSGATLKLSSEVKSITKVANQYVIATKNSLMAYDAVIIAAPLPLTSIKFINFPKASFPKVDYLHLHVTLLTTTTPSLLPAYFKLNSTDTLALPGTVITTSESGIQPEFNSIRYQAAIQKNGKTEYVVKMFSKTKISDETLAILFGKGKVGWLYRKEWDAYPYFPKRTDFPPVKIDKGLYYVNAMEGLLSTMETETISSRNVVDLLSTELLGSGLCPGGAKGPVTDNYVVGWDC